MTLLTAKQGRLFPAHQVPVPPDDELQKIIDFFPTGPASSGNTVPAGYTYFGQFLAHELVSGNGVGSIRSPVLDLDSIYGRGWLEPLAPRNEQTGEFLLGWATAFGKFPRRCGDLLRDATRRAIIPEPRNDENLIIAQLHLLFQRFHNGIIRFLKRSDPRYHAFSGEQMYGLARLLTIDTLQRIALHDYLSEVTQTAIREDIFNHGNRYIVIPPEEKTLPAEFTHAVFRFGHSQVRNDYTLNVKPTVEASLAQSFLLTGRGGLTIDGESHDTLRSDFVIDWRLFFRIPIAGRRDLFQSAKKIDPIIEPGMRDLHEKGIKDIVKRNLLAGFDKALPWGQTVAEAVLERFPRLETLGIHRQLALSGNTKHRMTSAGIAGNTPLWIYTLVEADEYAGDGGDEGRGLKLGPLASLIVCETLRNAVENYATANHEPPDPAIGRGDIEALREKIAVNDMTQLIKFTQQEEMP